MIKRNGIIVALLLVIATSPFFFSHAENRHIFKSFMIGFSTPQDNDLWVSMPKFDDDWRVPVGKISCCWKEAHSVAAVFNKFIPHKVDINWLVTKSEKRYETTLFLEKNLEDIAKKLPPIHLTVSGESKRFIFLIFGIDENNNVTAWISNSSHNKNLSGRVIYKVGEAKGHAIKAN